MRLDRHAIENLDSAEFTSEDKRYLVEKFFPKEQAPEWKQTLTTDWRFKGLFQKTPAHNSAPYRVSHPDLRFAAVVKPPTTRGTAVTDFTGWVFSLYNSVNPQAMSDGRAVERELLYRSVPRLKDDGWMMLFEGISENGDRRSPKPISALKVNGSPLFGAPDFVFQERKTGRIVVVEVKVTNRYIPSNGWPNLRAQLWAYSHIDEWSDVPEVLLIGEVWGFDSKTVFRRQVLRWKAHARELGKV
jgi:hypothetical protein